GVALVDVLVRESEHVIVEPVRAHGLVPVAGDLIDAAAVAGSARACIGGSGIDGGKPRQHPWPVVVVELIRPEIGSSEAIVLRAVMSIVFMRGERGSSKAAVILDVSRQAIVMAEQDRFAIADLGQLGRKRALERPYPVCVLSWEAGMKFWRDRCGRIDSRIQVRGYLRVVGSIRGHRLGGDLNRYLWRKLRKPLVRPIRSRRTALNGPHGSSRKSEPCVKQLLRLVGLGHRRRI